MSEIQYDLISVKNITLENGDHSPFIDERKGLQLMKKMGYKLGGGLGKGGNGIIEPIGVFFRNNTSGLGYIPKNYSEEEVRVKETLYWLENDVDHPPFANVQLESFLKIANPHEYPISYDFCDTDIFDDVIRTKDDIFERYPINALNRARARANVFEKIRSVFFMNRAALKLANIDAATNFMFSNIDKNKYHRDSDGPFYFADVCAGPGGFSEYILWRKGWLFKGFGLTLKGENDFELNKSCCISPHSFQAYYGSADDGDVCNPENIDDFKEKVLYQTNGLGVHFMTSDGGFCVEGDENNQEILSKNIYLCQCLVALEIVRTHGHFVTKLFDVFTPFSVGLIYLMYKCFEKVCILKPNSSRPANAERYLICCNLQDSANKKKILKYLQMVSRELWKNKDNDLSDVLEIVSLETMKSDTKFFKYIENSNNEIGRSQITALKKLETFCEFSKMSLHGMQDQVKYDCLKYWNIPNLFKRKLNLENEDKDYELELSRDKNGFSTDTCKWVKDRWVREEKLNLTKGTLLYGEIVKESIQPEKTPSSFRYSLHIIDAICLGDMDLRKLPFEERMRLISVYAESINPECQQNLLRIRKKTVFDVKHPKFSETLIKKKKKTFFTSLPASGFKGSSNYHRVKSLLFFKNSDPRTTFFSRIQLKLKKKEDRKLYTFLMNKLEKSVRR